MIHFMLQQQSNGTQIFGGARNKYDFNNIIFNFQSERTHDAPVSHLAVKYRLLVRAEISHNPSP